MGLPVITKTLFSTLLPLISMLIPIILLLVRGVRAIKGLFSSDSSKSNKIQNGRHLVGCKSKV